MKRSGCACSDDGVLLGGVEALDIELLEVGRLDDRHVHRPIDEEVSDHRLRVVLLELLLGPDLLLGAERAVVGIEAVDELLAVDVALVGRRGIPEVGVPVDDEQLFPVAGPVHHVPP